jgi:hypothetical protein
MTSRARIFRRRTKAACGFAIEPGFENSEHPLSWADVR